MTSRKVPGMPAPFPSSIDNGTPPATAVKGAAAETTRKVTAPTPRAFLRNWFAPVTGEDGLSIVLGSPGWRERLFASGPSLRRQLPEANLKRGDLFLSWPRKSFGSIYEP
ncbi:hypothetical protein D9M70_500290 [compost metagenome]